SAHHQRLHTKDKLASRPESVEFARQLWARLLPALKPRIIITMDTTTAAALIVILSSTLGPPASKSLPVGWGTYVADLHRFAGDKVQFALHIVFLGRRCKNRRTDREVRDHVTSAPFRYLGRFTALRRHAAVVRPAAWQCRTAGSSQC